MQNSTGSITTGYVAAWYFHSNGCSTYHQFDNKCNSLQLIQVALTVAYQLVESFGVLVNVAVGDDVKILNTAQRRNSSSIDIIQGYLQYVSGPLTVIIGIYVTLGGAEVIALTENTNFSNSLLLCAESLAHTGIRAI